eukprot:CAMPEP_0115446532 /NCGR_PEP_ID=MMETSP0271-20121206/39498_1 /TAXON_ID=71861 /ORGANISM="Scrippsiella trochoidea, Strain CCMP3099" /LENGTH=129 /DNA_ID=CAMNT_0002872573 /DNA_START=704 /DNA_END=1094 /DNA_ORIENTATION=+
MSHDQANNGIQAKDAVNNEIADVEHHACWPILITWHHGAHHAAQTNDAISGALVQNIRSASHYIVIAIVAEFGAIPMETDRRVAEGHNHRPQEGHRQRSEGRSHCLHIGLQQGVLAEEVQHEEAEQPEV